MQIADLGNQPLAGQYPLPGDPEPEPTWPLRAAVCANCWLVQLRGDVPVEPQEPGTAPADQSTTMQAHLRGFAAELGRLSGSNTGPVIEVASHGGYLHDYLAEIGLESVVAEQSPKLVEDLRARGVPVTTERLLGATDPARTSGPTSSLVVDNYLLAHVPDPNALVAGLRGALQPGGHLVLEFDHVAGIVGGGQFDALRHGHFTYWSLHALEPLLERHGLRVVDVVEQPVYGGALRVVARHLVDDAVPSPAVAQVLASERTAGLDRPEAFSAFAGRVALAVERLRGFLEDERGAGRLVAGYGAPSRGATLLNAAGVTQELLPFTVDRSPAKQGRLMPGSRVPIFGPERLRDAGVDVVLILTWDISAEVIAQLGDLRQRGTRFAVPIPSLEFRDA
jgi:SAM-dependent methyltransferase